MSSLPSRPLSAHAFPALKGTVRVPGDKSCSHRALMFRGTALGETKIYGLLTGENVIATSPGTVSPAVGAAVTCAVMPGKLYLFDAKTEKSLGRR